MFSFNNPYGACDECDGLGVIKKFDESLVIPNPSLSLRSGALAPWASSSSKFYMQTLHSLTSFYKVNLDQAFKDLPEEFKKVILYGSGNTQILMMYDDGIKS